MASEKVFEKPPSFQVDLDAPPEKRWEDVIAAHLHVFPEVLAYLDSPASGLPKTLVTLASTFMSGLARTHLLTAYVPELKAISARANFPLGRLVLLTLMYELCAACTSIVVSHSPFDQLRGAGPVLFRTMDWELPLLKKLTVHLQFHRSGVPCFEATSWAGYVGVLTGMRTATVTLPNASSSPSGSTPGRYAVAVNYRRIGSSGMVNVWCMLTRKWPVGFVVRHCLENKCSFDEAVSFLSTERLISPVYFSVVGEQPGQATILTRSRREVDFAWCPLVQGPSSIQENQESASNVVRENNRNQFSWMVQTNCDSFEQVERNGEKDIMWSVDRIAAVEMFMASVSKDVASEIGQKKYDLKAIHEKFLSRLRDRMRRRPVYQHETIYITEMRPSHGLIEDWIHVDEL